MPTEGIHQLHVAATWAALDRRDYRRAHLNHDAVVGAPFDNFLLLTKWMKLDLVHGWELESRIGNFLEMASITEEDHISLQLQV
jgi:hypothetical protein